MDDTESAPDAGDWLQSLHCRHSLGLAELQQRVVAASSGNPTDRSRS